jgi:hypothetical protein
VGEVTSKRWVALLVGGAFLGCQAPSSGEPPLADLSAIQDGDTIRLSISPNREVRGIVLDPDLQVHGLTMPTDIAPIENGTMAVLDRLDRTVVLLDGQGQELARFGREGDGPGEYEEPYAIEHSAEHFGIWDKNGRLTILRSDGSVVSTTTVGPGDVRAIWQRVPTTNWDEPLQLSREDATRRLSSLGGGSFGLLLQEQDERTDSDFFAAAAPKRFPFVVLRVDSLGQVTDTVGHLRGQALWPAETGDGRFQLAWERPFALRPLWTAGDGWQALAHGSEPEVLVLFDSGDTLRVRWPLDTRPLGDADFHHYIDWEVEAYRRTRGDRLAERASEIPRGVWIEEELSVSDERPQLMGLLSSGRCLAIAGFDAEGGPHGESGTWIVLPLEDPGRLRVFDLGGEVGFIRAFSGQAFYRIVIEPNGERRVDRLPVDMREC